MLKLAWYCSVTFAQNEDRCANIAQMLRKQVTVFLS